MKKSIKIILSFIMILFVISPIKTNAKDDSFYIKDYEIEAIVHENATVSITEKITADFNEYKHGIFRDIPIRVRINKEVNGESKEYLYANPISNINVEGAPFSLTTEDDMCRITIGDEDKTVIGEQKYIISYLLDLGDDRIDSYDEFYFNLIGTEWDTNINNVNFTIKFDKDTDLSKIKMYSGTYGSANESNVSFYTYNNTVTGYVKNPLGPKEGVTIYTKLPQGYYVGARTKSSRPYKTMAVIASISCIALFFLGIKRIGNPKNKVVETIEFYPPEGLSSADVGYIIDGVANDKDMISLIIWFAHKGYLLIEEKEKDIYLHKNKSLPEGEHSYLKTIYNGLFSKGEITKLSGLKENFFTNIQDGKKQIKNYYKTEKKLYNNRKFSAENILSGIYLIAIILAGYFSAPILSGVVYFILPFIAIGGSFIGFAAIIRSWFKSSKFNSIKGLIVRLVIIFIVLLVTGGMATLYSIYSSFYPLLLITEMVAILSYGFCNDPTEYKVSITGKLLGLKKFIQKAELEQINKLVEENPLYYFDVLPYAYVFGLTDKWIKKFETIACQPPDWYYSDSTFNYIIFSHALTGEMDKGLSNAKTDYNNTHASSSDGGGFSGGGSGGGGGGSW
ncbi:MAG: DUF2207 domain-containing protein [Clostridiales bacterium]|nr:DUF2207 domain-containing protein [Clostridiales bacterium]